MCDVATGLAVVSGVVSLAGSIQQTRAIRQQTAFQATVANNNEIITGRLAEDARARGKAEADRQALRTVRFIGRQRVAQAAFGQVVDVGSALDLTADTAATGKLEERTIRANAEREAIGFLTQGVNFAAEAELARLRGDSARRAGIIEGFGTILTTAGTVADKWRNRPSKIPTFDILSANFGVF